MAIGELGGIFLSQGWVWVFLVTGQEIKRKHRKYRLTSLCSRQEALLSHRTQVLGMWLNPRKTLWRESETKMSYAELAFDVSEAVRLSLCTHCVSLSKHCPPPPSLLLYGQTRQSWLGSTVQVKEQMTAQFRIPGAWIWLIQLFISSSSSYGCGRPPTPTPHLLCEEREEGEMGGRKGGRKGGVALREWGLLGWGTLVKHPSSTLWGETTLIQSRQSPRSLVGLNLRQGPALEGFLYWLPSFPVPPPTALPGLIS